MYRNDKELDGASDGSGGRSIDDDDDDDGPDGGGRGATKAVWRVVDQKSLVSQPIVAVCENFLSIERIMSQCVVCARVCVCV